jgi:hypothetical protein
LDDKEQGMKLLSRKAFLNLINGFIILEFSNLLVRHFIGPISFKFAGFKFSLTHYEKPLLIITGLWILRQILIYFPFRKLQKTLTGKGYNYYLGILIISAATLLLEITMTRIFAVIFFNQFAFLIISTALFGFGLSGVVLSISRRVHAYNLDKFLTFLSLAFGVSTLITLKVVVDVPLRFSAISQEPIQLFYLTVYYLALGTPFFFSGMIIALLLSHLPKQVNTLYFYDLLGAGIGCFIIVLVISKLGGSGTVIFSALMGFAGAIFFSFYTHKKFIFLSSLFLVAGAFLLPYADKYFEIQVHEIKRTFNFDVKTGKIEFTRWSAVSRVDVADMFPYKIIWINGGTNTAYMVPYREGAPLPSPSALAPVVYRLKKNFDILIVGPAGGAEVLEALSYGPNSIIGVELDPIITDIVQNEYKTFIGNIYGRPNVKLINDEGRSYISRSKEKFDIIQQINNASPIAIASGALNLSESYLLTVEAFHAYLDHLKEDGYLYIRRQGAIRLASVAAQTLRERGITNPEDYMVIISEGSPIREGFCLKKSPITLEELETFQKYVKGFPNYKMLYDPSMKKDDNLYYHIISRENGWKDYLAVGFNLSPAIDDRPFFNHFKRFASFKLSDQLPEPLEVLVGGGRIESDTVLLIILAEAAILSVLFIILPLYIFNRAGLRTRDKGKFLIYFFSLGLGFILIEISLIQKFTLFIGYPAHSITAVLFSILVSAGVGSYLSGRLVTHIPRALTFIILGITLQLILQLMFTVALFETFLGQPLVIRILISIAVIMPLGLLLGMPFPLGIRMVDRIAPKLIPWVWGINGYATVIGSVLCVILALVFGFKVVLILAGVIYLLGLLALLSIGAEKS